MNSRLLNLPVIVFTVLAVGIGMYVYNSSHATVSDYYSTMSTLEIEAFNNQFTEYAGNIVGSNVKALISRLITNANTYKEETYKIPGLVYEQLKDDELIEQTVVKPFESQDDYNKYVMLLNKCRNEIDSEHNYYLEMSYQDNGLVDYIHISYDESNPITNLLHR